MEPNVLDTDIQFMKGVGPRRGDVLNSVGIHTYRDLLYYFPRRYLDRSTVTPIRELRADSGQVTVVGTVVSTGMIPRGKPRFEVTLMDESGGRISGLWFNRTGWIKRIFSKGDPVAFHGTVKAFRGNFSIIHPEFDQLDEGQSLDTGRIIPLYKGGAALEKAGLTSRTFRRLIYNLIKEHGWDIPEVLPDTIQKTHDLIDGRPALRAIHFPKTLEERGQAARRLKFEEFFFLQLKLATTRQIKRNEAKGVVLEGSGPFLQRFLRDLPFELTAGQNRTIEEIADDATSGRQMNRMIQGDVGSGKTVVAVAAILMAVDAGYQAAFMAPTEILAEQHYRSLIEYLEPLGLSVRLLIGGQRKKLREEILADLANGQSQVAVGTHALIEEKVTFAQIGMAIVDEQHRFGVMQRARMFGKGSDVHMLLMSATPIPRSLAMTLYGDVDVSVMKEMPANRIPIKTRLFMESEREQMYELLKAELRMGHQAYIVYPLVEESEKLDLKNAEDGFQEMTERFRANKVGMVHGRLLSYEREEEMDAFKRGEIDVMVSTTVIEVGVDVPNATVMVIEHAERFGLSQLHQLRGRVGRSDIQSFCFLMSDHKRTNEAKIRLETMVETTDGFKISETDLKLRGAGDFFGTRQSGLPDLKIGDIVADQDILIEAREAALTTSEQDPHLRDSENQELRAQFVRLFSGGIGMAGVG